MNTNKGFTRIELLIVILILGILSVIALPIYKEYVKKSLVSEGKALTISIQSVEKIYYSEFGSFYEIIVPTSFDPNIGIDAKNNKIFKTYNVRVSNTTDPKSYEIIAYGQNAGKEISISLKGIENSEDIEFSEKL
jgi:type IV pilus assembly protein PilE